LYTKDPHNEGFARMARSYHQSILVPEHKQTRNNMELQDEVGLNLGRRGSKYIRSCNLLMMRCNLFSSGCMFFVVVLTFPFSDIFVFVTDSK
jgi:hypothetical protein